MEKFTKKEISWLIKELDRQSVRLQNYVTEDKCSNISALLQLKSEQYADIADRLKKVLYNRDKRIEIIY